MPRHPPVLIGQRRENHDRDSATQPPSQQNKSVQLYQQNELFHIGATTQKVQQREDGTDQHCDETQREEKLRRHHEPRNEEAPDFVIAGGEGVVDPATAHEEAPVFDVVGVRQGAEAVRPQSQAVEFGSGDSVVGDQPAGGREGDGDEDEADHEEGDGDVASQRAPFCLK